MEQNKLNEEIKVNKVNEIIDYQPGGIVSRQIIKKQNGNLTYFAFDKNESLSEHTSPYEAVVNIIEGEMEITIGGDPFIVKANELILLPANIPHGLVAKTKTKMILTMIKS